MRNVNVVLNGFAIVLTLAMLWKPYPLQAVDPTNPRLPFLLSNSIATNARKLNGQTSVTLSGLRIEATLENCIELRNCHDVLIENCVLRNADGEGVHLISCTSVTIRGCWIEEVRTGIYAVDSQGISVSDCIIKNIRGPMPRGQMVQLDKVTGAGNRITSNTMVSEPGNGNPEDAISIYKSGGTETNPLVVLGNRIIGGGPSLSGGGIMVGDSGGQYIVVSDNKLEDPGQYGIAVSGGRFIKVLNNVIYGKAQPFTNVGLYVWAQGGAGCGEIEVKGNQVSWRDKNGNPNPCWNGGNCGSITGWDNNNWNAVLNSEILNLNKP